VHPAPLASQATDSNDARQRTASALLRRDARPASRPTAAGVSLHEHDGAEGRTLVADNRAYGPMQIAVYLEAAGGARLVGGLRVVPARAEIALWPLVEGGGADDYALQQIPGDPAAHHVPAEPYRLPYALGSRYVVSQAFPERVTHLDRSSEHAIDFEMPVGTEVYAARAGVVMEVAGDYYGVDVPADATLPANLVRVLHDDGTMALYAHLQWNSIRVEPGQRIARGELLANSGNTGFSTGPHLHFVVQRNRGGFVVSVPVEFVGSDGRATSLRSDEAPIAY
jgi:murein DD-endopeptidase MepM/ murein hydrolase activator NlpD